MTREQLLLPTLICGFIAMCCVVSLTTRDHGLGPIAVTDASDYGPDSPIVVEGRKHRTPEQQAVIDHRREERAKRWGIFLHYLGLGAASYSTGGLWSWITLPFNLLGSLLSFCWSVGVDCLLLIGIVLVGCFAVCVVCGVMFCRWVFGGRK